VSEEEEAAADYASERTPLWQAVLTAASE